ncbi:ninjurin-2 isoform X3 [Achroia grisella]|uniref:ninjurin-2 isoform X3 n=1 Tax=Achroia grisella TaxID=688607 RepID=UPI0027D2BADC|nr:ninjurin-2 isoform X3 [Achroia grisella]
MAGETEKIENSDASENPTVNIEDIVYIGQNAPTEIVSDDVKGLDANRYATKKTVAQGMLDIALLTSNASQLKYVLQVGPKHEFYTLLVVLISISIVLQVVSALVALVLGCIYNINHQPDHRVAEILNNITLGFKSVGIALNILISVLYSSEVDDIIV